MNKYKQISTIVIGITITMLLFGCNPFKNNRDVSVEMTEDEFLKEVEPYLAKGESIDDISTVPPAPGYLSEAEVLKRVALDFLESGMLNLEYRVNRNGKDISLDQSWLRDTKVHLPVTVHNFNPISTADNPQGYDYYYMLHASHPEMGSVFEGVFTYNENTGNNIGLGMCMGPAVNGKAHEHYHNWDASGYSRGHVVTQKEAGEFFNRTVGKALRGVPVAVLYSYDGPMDEAAFQWYFETDARSAGASEGYLMDALISMQSTSDLDDPLSYMQRVNSNYQYSDAVAFAGTPLPTLISKLPEPLGLYDAMETQSRQAHPQALRELVQVPILGRGDFQPVH